MSDQSLVVRDYFESGELISEHMTVAGVKQGTERGWHKNGQIFYEMHYVGGRAEGPYSQWDESGRPLLRTNLKQGKNDGFYQSWWNSGALKEEGYYVDDVRQPGYRWYSADGTLWSTYEKAD
jgi:antitoxin component YwqK of YwqJK toxin-antitoxin module